MKKKSYLKISRILTYVGALSYVCTNTHAKQNVNICSIKSIEITPKIANINSASSQQFTAIGTLPNGLTEDITSSVIWNSSNTAVATIASNGLATSVLPSLPAVITAKLPPSCSNGVDSSATLTVIPRFAYIANVANQSGLPSVSLCHIDPLNGLFTPPCSIAAIFSNPSNVTIHKFGGQAFAYITDGANIGSTIWQCKINPETGLFGESCIDATKGSFKFSYPAGMVFYTARDSNTYAYVTEATINIPPINRVSKCLVNPTTGLFSACGDSGAGPVFQGAGGINYNTSGDETFFYIAVGNSGAQDIAKCRVNYNGDISNKCVTLTTSETYSGSLNINFFKTFENQNYAYIAQYRRPSFISRCQMDAKGSFTPADCTNVTIGTKFTAVQSNVFIAMENKIFVYINDGPDALGAGNRVWRCELDSSNFNLINCMDSGVGQSFNFPTLNPAFL